MSAHKLARLLVEREFFGHLDAAGALALEDLLLEVEAEGWTFEPPAEAPART